MPASGYLVGRQTELSQLILGLTEHTARAVVVCGDPGVGKTSLIDQLCASARSSGWRVVRIQGVESEESYVLGGLNQLVFSLKESLAGLDEQSRTVLLPVLAGDADLSVSVLPLAAAVRSLVPVVALPAGIRP